MKNIKNQKGITLVALVVTIIILIILAGVSINAIIGENGIITIAKKAKENVELAQIEEQTKLNEIYMQLETEEGETGRLPYDAIGKLSEFKKKIADYIDEAANGSIDLINEYVKPNYETASVETFGSAIKQIVAKVTKLNETKAATSEDILEGKEAWVNGKLITGDAKSFKNKRFLIKDGVIQDGITFSSAHGAVATQQNGYIKINGNGTYTTIMDVTNYSYLGADIEISNVYGCTPYAGTTNGSNNEYKGFYSNQATYLGNLFENTYIGVKTCATAANYIKLINLWIE